MHFVETTLQIQRFSFMKARQMNRKTLLLIAALLIVGVSLAFVAYLFLQPAKLVEPSWLKKGAFMTYEQFFVWSGQNETRYMIWNTTWLRDDLAGLGLISHGVNVTGGNVVITHDESNWTINAVTREIINSSYLDYIGKKWAFWIETNVAVGSPIDIFYGISTITESEFISVLGMQRDCWIVEYNWSTANMKRWYDKSSGILLKVNVVLYRENVTIEITETAVLTNVDLES